ncbi:F0F1 ATP synthase subunit A [Candidatus Peregrinibacteria bacterium]|nr:F0F1 ATP synthase subunit A [Candidatus Peregrinibacteria bacterium]
MEGSLNISVAPEAILTIGGIELSSSMISSVFVTLILFGFVFAVRSRLKIIPGNLQIVAEGVVGFFYDQLLQAYGGDAKKAKRYLALIVSLFLFIFVSNQFTIIPLTQSIVVDGVNVFRAPTSHFSLTLALAIITFLVSNVIAFSMSPIKWMGNFVKIGSILKIRKPADVGQALLDLFLGVLDIVGELAKVISLSARLFGNVFAGEVMVVVIASLSVFTRYFVPVPFYALGLLSGLIQALVFAVLSLSFIAGMHNTIEEAVEQGKEEKANKKKAMAT